MKYTLQELYRGQVITYDNINDLYWDMKEYVKEHVPFTVNYVGNSDTMTQHEHKVVSALYC